MPRIRRLVLDVLKPHQPNALDFATALADLGSDYRVKLKVMEVDEKTETIILTIEGENILFETINATVSRLGASVHSIDEVEVDSENRQIE